MIQEFEEDIEDEWYEHPGTIHFMENLEKERKVMINQLCNLTSAQADLTKAYYELKGQIWAYEKILDSH